MWKTTPTTSSSWRSRWNAPTRSAATSCAASRTPTASSRPYRRISTSSCATSTCRGSRLTRRCRSCVARRCSTPLVVVTRAIGEEAAVHVLRCGAKDYLTKDKLGTLPQIIERVMTERRRALEQERLGARTGGRLSAAEEAVGAAGGGAGARAPLISRELHDQLGPDADRHGDPPARGQARRRSRRPAASTPIRRWRWRKARSSSSRPCRSRCGRRSSTCWGWWPAVQTAVQRIAEPAGLAFSVTARGKDPAEAEAKPPRWRCGWCRKR